MTARVIREFEPEPPTTRPILTISEVCALYVLHAACIHGSPIRRLMPDGDTIVEGTARSLGDERGNFSPPGMDVRDMFMRVTSRTGFEYFWPVSELTPQVHEHTLVVD